MYRMRDIARKGLAPPVLLLLCLLINIWARWPILMHIDEVFTISWRVCTALVTGGISLVLSLTGLACSTQHGRDKHYHAFPVSFVDNKPSKHLEQKSKYKRKRGHPTDICP